MKKRLTALLLALALCLGTALAVEGDIFAGQWVEPLAGRCFMNIDTDQEGYLIHVTWSSSAFQTYGWELKGTFSQVDMAIAYTGTKSLFTYYEDGTAKEEKQGTVSGKLVLQRGQLYWAEVGEEPVVLERADALAPVTGSFTDVYTTDYFYTPVEWANAAGVTTGVGQGFFDPAGNCTRAQVVTFLYRMAQGKKTGKSKSFTDVPADSWYADAVSWAVEKGITNGTDQAARLFSPNLTCTRAQVITMIYRLFGEPSPRAANVFTDVPEGIYYEKAVVWARQTGILSDETLRGDLTAFDPDGVCIRADIVTFLYNAVQYADRLYGVAPWLE